MANGFGNLGVWTSLRSGNVLLVLLPTGRLTR